MIQWGSRLRAGPPGPRGSPRTRSSFGINFLPNARGRPGGRLRTRGPPHNLCRCSEVGKLSDIGLDSPPHSFFESALVERLPGLLHKIKRAPATPEPSKIEVLGTER